MGNTVKKQHYVWRKYLSEWTDSGDRFKGKLWLNEKVKSSTNKCRSCKRKRQYQRFHG